MRRIIALPLALLLVLALAGCSLSSFEEYDNFYNDMDIRARMEDYLEKARNGDTSPFFRDEVLTMLDDLHSMDTRDNQQAHEVNSLYIGCAVDILDVIDANKAEDDISAGYNYEQASFQFAEANSRYEDFTVAEE